MKVLTVVGTRPNFIKITQFQKCFSDAGIDHRIVHTGQHYDEKMANIFFKQFRLFPDFWLNVPPSSPNSQIAKIMSGIENLVNTEFKPDLMIVVGDVNSTLAAAIAANKLNIKFAHLESGLRSEDRGMPEEINRILTDEISDLYFVTEQSGIDNLLKEGKSESKISFVGNTMIDTLVAFNKQIENSTILKELELEKENFALMTMHRPATVDFQEGLENLLTIIENLTANQTLVFPIHPRTLNRFNQFGLSKRLNSIQNLILAPPMDYFSFQKLIKYSKFVITDSGGIQEETTFQKVPCLTLRPNTERPSTITIGTNELITFNVDVIKKHVKEIENGSFKIGTVPPLWDGKSTQRIVEVIKDYFLNKSKT